MAQFPRPGKVEWNGLRSVRTGAVQAAAEASATFNGLAGDHRKRPGKRAVSLIQAEHLPVIAALAGLEAVSPATLRRNLVVSGFSLSAARGRVLQLGASQLRIVGPCAPCSRMEAALGVGGYNAMRGHGGMTAEVVLEGPIAVGDAVTVCDDA